jgi:hypothetical protein
VHPTQGHLEELHLSQEGPSPEEAVGGSLGMAGPGEAEEVRAPQESVQHPTPGLDLLSSHITLWALWTDLERPGPPALPGHILGGPVASSSYDPAQCAGPDTERTEAKPTGPGWGQEGARKFHLSHLAFLFLGPDR